LLIHCACSVVPFFSWADASEFISEGSENKVKPLVSVLLRIFAVDPPVLLSMLCVVHMNERKMDYNAHCNTQNLILLTHVTVFGTSVLAKGGQNVLS